MALYRQLYQAGGLKERVEQALSLLKDCHLCPRGCGVNRLEGELGQCRTGRQVMVSSAGPHFGEEAPLVGTGGSGTIFFTYCNLKCCFCQNYTISQVGDGHVVGSDELARMMLSLEHRGCHNINFVSPTHVVPQILEALMIAAEAGLSVPLVYNSGGYDLVDTLRILDGVVDIYMPDMKYSDEKTARRFSGIKNYPVVNRAAIKEMHRQVGDLKMNDLGIASRGLLVRHLVLPRGLAGTDAVCRFLGQKVSKNTYLNIMAQYRPCFKAFDIPELSRPLSSGEFNDALRIARENGLQRLDKVEDRSIARILRIR